METTSSVVKQTEQPYKLLIIGTSPQEYQIAIDANKKTVVIGSIKKEQYTGGKFGYYWHGFIHVKIQNKDYRQAINIDNTYLNEQLKHEIQNSICLLLSDNNLTISNLINYSKVNQINY